MDIAAVHEDALALGFLLDKYRFRGPRTILGLVLYRIIGL
jgi:hypothetical protein